MPFVLDGGPAGIFTGDNMFGYETTGVTVLSWEGRSTMVDVTTPKRFLEIMTHMGIFLFLDLLKHLGYEPLQFIKLINRRLNTHTHTHTRV